jgi:hypothetical protein
MLATVTACIAGAVPDVLDAQWLPDTRNGVRGNPSKPTWRPQLPLPIPNHRRR